MRWFLALLLLASPLCAREVSVVALEVSATRKLRLENAVESAFELVSSKTGLTDLGPLNLTLTGNARTFEQLAASDGVGMSAENVLGYALPASRKVVLNLAAIDQRRLSELGVLRHEIAHLVLGASLFSKRPLWFEEGVAQWVESVALDALIEATSQELVPPSYASFDELNAGLRDGREAGAAYKQARTVVEFIVSRHGEAKLRVLLKKLTNPGTGFTAAFAEATGEDLGVFEKAALGELASRRDNLLILFVGANWWWMLFSIGALLALALWFKRRQRSKKIIDQWEEDEKFFPSDPSWSYAGDQDEPSESFRRDLQAKIGERDEEGEQPPPITSEEGLKHWYDKRREQKPAPSPEELKQWLEDEKPPQN